MMTRATGLKRLSAFAIVLSLFASSASVARAEDQKPKKVVPARKSMNLRQLSPWVVAVGTVATGFAGGSAIWSAVGTTTAREAYENKPTPDRQAFVDATIVRTHVAIGATIALGAVTAIVAALFTDYGSRQLHPAPSFGPTVSTRASLGESAGSLVVTF